MDYVPAVRTLLVVDIEIEDIEFEHEEEFDEIEAVEVGS